MASSSSRVISPVGTPVSAFIPSLPGSTTSSIDLDRDITPTNEYTVGFSALPLPERAPLAPSYLAFPVSSVDQHSPISSSLSAPFDGQPAEIWPSLDLDGAVEARPVQQTNWATPKHTPHSSIQSAGSNWPESIPTPPEVPDKDTLKRKMRRKSRLQSTTAAVMPSNDTAIHQPDPDAWLAGQDGRPPYDLNPLLHGLPVSELWDDSGDTLVYLFPRSANARPSFRICSKLYASSLKLASLAKLDVERSAVQPLRLYGVPLQSASSASRLEETHEAGPVGGSERHSLDDFFHISRQIHLYLPIALNPSVAEGSQLLTEFDKETLIDVRNVFAFLSGQPIVATKKRRSLFTLFTNISKILHVYDFTNADESTFGEVASRSFARCVDEFALDDVRGSSEKTIEALVLGERMRSIALYNEAFVHAAGKYDDLQAICKLPAPGAKFALLSSTTRSRLERASIDLQQRQKAVDLRLLDFDFPSVFAGVMHSKMVEERKYIRFDGWRNAFYSTRRFVLSYLKAKYGSWPPKAKSKKNELGSDGLSRIVLKALYFDFADAYDLYVDRTSITTRPLGASFFGAQGDLITEEPAARIIRRVFDEFDRSSPPVQPPIPFDTPILPSSSRLGLSKLASKDQDPKQNPFSTLQLSQILEDSVNSDTLKAAGQSDFLSSLRDFEARHAKSASLAELSDFRAGMWIFIYAVLQSLPMLVVDAPDIKYHQGVDYFLCEPPRAGVPWANSTSESNKFQGQGWSANGVEATYARSHCWVVAEKWNAELSPVAGPAEPTAGLRHANSIREERRERKDVRRYDSKRRLPPLDEQSTESGPKSAPIPEVLRPAYRPYRSASGPPASNTPPLSPIESTLSSPTSPTAPLLRPQKHTVPMPGPREGSLDLPPKFAVNPALPRRRAVSELESGRNHPTIPLQWRSQGRYTLARSSLAGFEDFHSVAIGKAR